MSKVKLCSLCLGIFLVLPCLALAAGTKPTISAISPTSASAGSAAFVLTVNGSGFVRGAVVLWNGSALTTTYVHATQLTATVPSTLLTTAGSATISVHIAGRMGGTSTGVAFTISAATTTTTSTTTTAAPLAISTTSIPIGTTGTAYSATLAVTGGTSPYAWSVTSGALPAGLTLSSAGAISGTPTTSGSASFTAQVKDSASNVQTYTYSTTIAAGTTTALAISTATLPGGTAGTAYPSTTLAATGGTPSYTWSVASGSTLPAGLTLSTAGALSGTPTTANAYSFSLQVADSASNTTTKSYSLTVGAATAASSTPTSGGVIVNCDFDTTCTDFGLFSLNIAGGTTAPVMSTDYAHSGTKSVKFYIGGAVSSGSSEMDYLFGASGHPAGEPLNPALSSTGIYRRWWQMVPSDYGTSLACDGQNRQYKWLKDNTSPGGGAWVMGTSVAYSTPCPWYRVEQDQGLDTGSTYAITGQLAPGTWNEIQTWYQRVTDGNETGKVIGTGNGTQTTFVYDIGHYPDLVTTVVHATIGGTAHTGVMFGVVPSLTGWWGCGNLAMCENNSTNGGVFGNNQSGICPYGSSTIWGSTSCPTTTSIVINFTSPPDNGTPITIDDTWGHGNVKVWVNGTQMFDSSAMQSKNYYWGTDSPTAQQMFRNGLVYAQSLVGPSATMYIDDYVLATQYVTP